MRYGMALGVMLALAVVTGQEARAQTKKFLSGTTVTILASCSRTWLNGPFDVVEDIETARGFEGVVDKALVVEIVPKTARGIQFGTGQFDVIDFTDQEILNLHDLFEPPDNRPEGDNTNIEQWKARFSPWLKDTFVFNGQMKYRP